VRQSMSNHPLPRKYGAVRVRGILVTDAMLTSMDNHKMRYSTLQVPGKKNLNTRIKNLHGGLSVRQNVVRGHRPAQTILQNLTPVFRFFLPGTCSARWFTIYRYSPTDISSHLR